MARGSVQRRFLQRLRRSALCLDYIYGVAETSPFGETLTVDERLGAHVRFCQVQSGQFKALGGFGGAGRTFPANPLKHLVPMLLLILHQIGEKVLVKRPPRSLW